MVLNRFDFNLFCYNYLRLYNVCGNVMVNMDQHVKLQRQKQKQRN